MCLISATVVVVAVHQMGETRTAARRNHFDNEETEILLIPDLEGDAEDDIVSKGELL